MTMCTEGLPQLLVYKKPQGMVLSAGANITGLNHTLQQLIAQLALYKLGNPRESTEPKQQIQI